MPCAHRCEGPVKSTRVPYLLGLELDSELLSHAPQDGQVGGVRRIRRVPKNSHAGDLRNRLLEQFKPLAAEVLAKGDR